jgi:CHAT domain-containing protein
MVSSYTPTLATLVRAGRSGRSFAVRESKLSVVAAERADDSALPRLWNVKEEVQCIVRVAEEAGILMNSGTGDMHSATTDQMSASLETAQFVHIACHGIQNSTKPLESSFCLSDGALSVTRLMELNLKDAFFAFLSACETAKGDTGQPDQTIHLAATMLFTGFKSVVATMW